MGDGDGATARIDSSLRSAPFRMTCGGCEGGWVPAYARTTGGGWVPASVFTGEGCPRGKGDGSPYTRGQRVGGGFPLPSSRGRAVRGGRGMGPRIREDNGWGVGSRFRLHGGGLSAGEGGWVPASARTTGGWVPAYARTTGGGLGQGDGGFANRPYGRRILSGTGFTPIPRLHEGRL